MTAIPTIRLPSGDTIPVLGLGVVTAALAYLTGIAGVRRLGARLASFIGLTEVLAAVGFAWLLLAELQHDRQDPRPHGGP